jgi:hypothetical protein
MVVRVVEVILVVSEAGQHISPNMAIRIIRNSNPFGALTPLQGLSGLGARPGWQGLGVPQMGGHGQGGWRVVRVVWEM